MGERSSQFFHGTSHDIVGGRILPAIQHDFTVWGATGNVLGQPSHDHAFATSDEDTAWTFAKGAQAHHQIWDENDPNRNNRPRVYSVHPHPEMRPGTYEQFHEYIAPHYDVKDRIDIMPGQQGTFPTLNWNQFRDKANWDSDQHDFNHPTDTEITYGHQSSSDLLAADDKAKDESIQANPQRHFAPYADKEQRDLFTGDTVGELQKDLGNWSASPEGSTPGNEFGVQQYFKNATQGRGRGRPVFELDIEAEKRRLTNNGWIPEWQRDASS